MDRVCGCSAPVCFVDSADGARRYWCFVGEGSKRVKVEKIPAIMSWMLSRKLWLAGCEEMRRFVLVIFCLGNASLLEVISAGDWLLFFRAYATYRFYFLLMIGTAPRAIKSPSLLQVSLLQVSLFHIS